MMTSQAGKQTITLNMFPNIPRSKNNHTIKLAQLSHVYTHLYINSLYVSLYIVYTFNM